MSFHTRWLDAVGVGLPVPVGKHHRLVVGVVIFSLLLGILASGLAPTPLQGLELLAHEAGCGLLLGYVTFRLLKSMGNYQGEVLLTLATVIGGYALAARLHVSSPLAMVVALTYWVVIFSILVRSQSIGKRIRKAATSR
jgi:hypothetical protein